MNGVAGGIGEHLHLDVARIDDALLEEHLGTAEGLGRFRDDPVPGVAQARLVVAATDAATAAARGGLQHHRIADALGLGHRLFEARKIALAPRRHRDAGLDHGAARLRLVAHATDDVGRRADEANTATLADGRELRVLGEKAVPRMDGVAAGLDREIHDANGIEISGEGVLAE